MPVSRLRRLLSFSLAVVVVGAAWSHAAVPARAVTPDALADTVIVLLNRDREERGLAPLRRHAAVMSLALERAGKIAAAGVLKHSAAGDLAAQLTARGIAWASYGEAIGRTTEAWGIAAAEHIYLLWQGSASHWSLLTSLTFDSLGVGFALAADGRTYASVVLIRSVEAAPTPAPADPPAPTPTPTPSPLDPPASPPRSISSAPPSTVATPISRDQDDGWIVGGLRHHWPRLGARSWTGGLAAVLGAGGQTDGRRL
jgi:uncharacterized protein YkwD